MQIKHVAECLAQREHFRMGYADSVRISDLGGGGRAGTVAGRLRKADTQSWCREWKVIKQHSTFDPINLLSRPSLTRKWVQTFFFISKACLIIPKRKRMEGMPPVCLHSAELQGSQSSSYSLYHLLQIAISKKYWKWAGRQILRWPASKLLGEKKIHLD